MGIMIWKVALRIARREALRHKGRSLLVATMLALPVAGASAADTMFHTVKLTSAEQLTRDMGQADARISFVVPAPIQQLPDGTVPSFQDSQQIIAGALQGAQIADPAYALPPGSRVLALPDKVDVRVRSPHGSTSLQAEERNLADPLAAGMYKQVDGVAPQHPDEVAVSTSVLKKLDKKIGDTLQFQVLDNAEPADQTGVLPLHKLRIVGEFDDPSHLDHDLVLPMPGALPHRADEAGPSSWLASVPGGLSWKQVLQLNAQGYSAASRVVAQNPPPDSEVPLVRDHPRVSSGSSRVRAALVAVGAVAVVMALLEVILLAGPAFAVGARRRQRDFGLLGAAGADRRRIRAIVLADGVVLGAAGGVIGVALGVATGWAVLPQTAQFTHKEPGAFRIAPAELAGAAALGVVTGLIAALIPAVSTGRKEVLESLSGGRRGARGIPWKLPLAGVVTIVLGVAMTGYGVFQPGIHTVPLAGGIAVAELGVVAVTPLFVALAGKAARWLPLAGRLALRDTARNRGRTAPAVAAILAAVAGSTAVAVLLATDDARGRAQYQNRLRPGQAALIFVQNTPGGGFVRNADGSVSSAYGGDEPISPPGAAKPVDVPKAIAAIGATLPLRSAAVIQAPDFRDGSGRRAAVKRDPENQCPADGSGRGGFVGGDAGQFIQADPRCRYFDSFAGAEVVPGDVAALRALTGTVDPAAEQVLTAGGIVVFDRYDLSADGRTATVALNRNCPPAGVDLPPEFKEHFAKFCSGPPPEPITLPAALAHQAGGSAGIGGGVAALVPQSVADRFGLAYQPQMILFDTTRMPSADEEQRANAAVEALGATDIFYVEHGYQGSDNTIMLALAALAAFVTLGAAAVATGLALTDGQADLETLAAVGARPRVRRFLAGSQATLTATIGAVLGSATGLLPAVAIIEAKSHAFMRYAFEVRNGGRGSRPSAAAVSTSSYLTIPWWFLVGTIVVLPLLAGAGAVLVTRSRVELRRRRG
jgi:putative ABC transport system permease protein